MKAVLLFLAAGSILGQGSNSRYIAVKDALGLRDSQVLELQLLRSQQKTADERALQPGAQATVTARVSDFGGFGSAKQENAVSLQYLLDDLQGARLAVIEKVLERSEMASQAIVLGLIDTEQWPGGSLCYYPLPNHSWEFELSNSQLLEFEKLQQATREPIENQIREKAALQDRFLKSGMTEDSITVVQLKSEMSRLAHEMASARPQRNLARALLNDTQKTKLVTFETALELAGEAIELGLIPAPSKAEILCN